MARSRFLLSPRWILGHLLVLAVALVCARLGFWQLHRLAERRDINARVDANLAAPPRSLEDVLAQAGNDPESVAYRRVTATGTFDAVHEVVLFGRGLGDRPGNHVLTPLVLADGSAVIVDRGWVPLEMEEPPLPDAAPPEGTAAVTGVLMPPEEDSTPEPGSSPQVTFRNVDLGLLRAQLPYDIAPLELWLQEQQPPQAGELPTAAPLPNLKDSPPHLSYAVQWFTFATIALIGYGVLVHKELRERGGSKTGMVHDEGT